MAEGLVMTGGDDPKRRGRPRSAKARAEGKVFDSRPFRGFDIERAAYEKLRPDLLERAEGKFVAFVGEEFVGPVDGPDEAEGAGYERFGVGPLYIKKIAKFDSVDEISREFSS